MKIVYYTSGTTGWGRIVLGISIGNALKRKKVKCKYTIISNSSKAKLAEEFHHIEIPLENEIELSKKNYPNSITYKTLVELKPDLLIINHVWFTVCNFIHELPCKKIYLSDLAVDRFFSILSLSLFRLNGT